VLSSKDGMKLAPRTPLFNKSIVDKSEVMVKMLVVAFMVRKLLVIWGYKKFVLLYLGQQLFCVISRLASEAIKPSQLRDSVWICLQYSPYCVKGTVSQMRQWSLVKFGWNFLL
jgi:hypothetical protein